ncbi:hypothetical protein RHSIM_Rhsim03G0057800 [Rhododendron simsii]|uniref:Uncharacterized protein n=1 Tax=Rhododendron simsii TaxID=118357 RepID=A0A834LS41_RHOSS|nr:hypothetical protein RHSIM_Rhsim03G0057800 [Rhododendron simsii]
MVRCSTITVGVPCLPRHRPDMYLVICYDIGSDSWDIYSKSCLLGFGGRRSSAFVDGVLYCTDSKYPELCLR